MDTNVLLYATVSTDSERDKRDRARAILRAGEVALSIQVLQEFYAQATRTSRPNRLSHAIAEALVRTWLQLPVQPMSEEILCAALALRTTTNFSYWDCAVIAAARAIGCQRLLTEDMAHGRIVEGVEIVDPFR